MGKLTEENYTSSFLRFGERQAGVNIVYCPEEKKYFYNAHCFETKILKELMSVEFEFLDDALELINDEFSTWDKVDFEPEKGCGSCAAK